MTDVDLDRLADYVGGALDRVTQDRADDRSLGGTTSGGHALFGLQVSPRWSIEFEPAFARAAARAGYSIHTGVPSERRGASHARSPSRMRTQPCEGSPGIAHGSPKSPWMPTTPPPGHSVSTVLAAIC